METKGYYHSKDTFGTVDGPGMRYVLFLSKCNLGCVFCHNPDTWGQGYNIITVQEVIDDLKKYRSFYDASGGGITVTGGEPLLQPEFIRDLFRACQEINIHTIVDTAGYVNRENFDVILPYTNQILFSVKSFNPQKHRELTVTDNVGMILNNLRYVVGKVPVTLRYVIIPQVTDTEEDLKMLVDFVKGLPVQVPVELLGYHTFGKAKWDSLGRKYQLDNISVAIPKDMARVAAILKKQNISCFY